MSKKQPNILVIFGDDIGITNLSCYSDGLMGYQTPNIDRIAAEGIRFTDYYGEQSCTAGRAAFMTGQSVMRTGLSKVGMPGADVGISDKDPTIAAALKEQGYSTGQFGKNHFGDLDKYLPTQHGFEEFYGVLYHLPANELTETPDYPTELAKERGFYPRGIVHSFDDGRVQDVGPLTTEILKDFDDQVVDRSVNFMKQAVSDDKPFFVWCNTTHMHYFTITKPESVGQAGRWQSKYHDTMIDHDKKVGTLLDYLEEAGIAEDTIVIYTTDNGPHANAWPDAATTPFRSEKDTNWEGAFRVPCVARWPKTITPGRISNEIVSHLDWFPTLLAAAGRSTIADDLKKGAKLAGRDYKVHLDGCDLTAHLKGDSESSGRNKFFYISDDGDVLGMRLDNFKIVFLEQQAIGTLYVWANPFTQLRAPKLFNLRTDPFERADFQSNQYYEWVMAHEYLIEVAQFEAREALATFDDFPMRQRPASFSLSNVVDKLSSGVGSH